MLNHSSLANNMPFILEMKDAPLVLIGGTKGFIPFAFKHSLKERMAYAGENTGNLVFQYAIAHILKANKLFISSGERIVFNDVRQDSLDYFLMPAANHLRSDADWSDFNGFLEKVKVPIVVVGLGAQSHIGMTVDECAVHLKTNKSIVDFANLLEEKAVYIGYRGQFSLDVGSRLGITKGEVIGCPSLMINENPRLGSLLKEQIDVLKEFSADCSNRISNFLCLPESPYSFSLGSEQAVVQSLLVSFAMQNKGFILQQSGGCDAINYFTGLHDSVEPDKLHWLHGQYQPSLDILQSQKYYTENGMLFFSAHEWIQAMKDLLFSVGSRFHGNMISLAASRLGVVIFHDARTSELAECMEIPRISRKDFIAALASDNPMYQFFGSIQFNPERFDETRKQIAKKWNKLSVLTRIPLHDHVARLANA